MSGASMSGAATASAFSYSSGAADDGPEWCHDEDGNELLDDTPVPEEERYEIGDEILDRLSIEAALDRLPPRDRTVIALMYWYDAPEDYVGAWPPTIEEVARYQAKYEARPRTGREAPRAAIAVTRVRERHREILARWKRELAGERPREAA